jgi:uncharacterized membrane protein YadS
MFILLIGAIPIFGWIMLSIWAMTGENETRKNFSRAIIAWFVVFVVVGIALQSMGRLPEIQKKLQGWTHRG